MNNTFINPYNFVPFGNRISDEGHKKNRQEVYLSESNKLVSGWLDMDIIIKTPLIVPDGAHPKYHRLVGKDRNNISVEKDSFIPLNDEEKKKSHKEYSFQKLPDENGSMRYAIPGSELRGAIRSAYESVTDSCVPFLLRDDNKLSQRVPVFGALHRKGLLCCEDGVWKLYSAKTVGLDEVTIKIYKVPGKKGKIEAAYKLFRKNGREVTEKTGDFSKANNGVVQYNIPVDTEKPYHVTYLQKNELIKEWNNDEPYQNMCSVLDRDAANIIGNNPNKRPCNDLKAALERERNGQNNNNGVPVYYFYVIPDEQNENKDNKLVYLSNSAIGRIAQRRKWKDIIGDHAPCDGKGQLCPACLLFGTKEGDGLKGRIRFTDAFSDEEVRTETHCLSILGGPRPSAFEYYLAKPTEEATYWNYDFYGIKVQHGDKVKTEYRHLENATPRGRKFYWHSNIQTDCAPSKLNCTMESICKGVFHSKVYFDEVSEVQLNDLMWVISMGENSSDSTRQYKLGHAKPLGYGSCKLVITGVHKRMLLMDKTGTISIKNEPEVPAIRDLSYGTDNEMVRSFLTIADTKSTCGKNVEYPNGAVKTYEWFAGNRKNADSLKVLPTPLSDSCELNNIIKNGKTVVLDKVAPDKKDPSKKVAYYQGGMVLGVPASVKQGDSIHIIEFKDGPRGKLARYSET